MEKYRLTTISGILPIDSGMIMANDMAAFIKKFDTVPIDFPRKNRFLSVGDKLSDPERCMEIIKII